MFELLSDFVAKSHPVTLGVLLVLSCYFILINWVFFYRWLSLNQWISVESETLETLLMGSNRLNERSYLSHFVKSGNTITKSLFDLAQYASTKEATKGLTVLSVVASTTPFIGLFGTVISILDTFDHIGQSSGTMSIIATGVSDALVATASGIFVAIFAYTYHQILKRQSFELVGLIRMQSDSLLSKEQ
ncbi:MAG: MotA/TolQ/ExbB proton channel family protein [Sulfuricurvum sp.]|jgi:biopolymer transport protein ExbB/TolQ|uniref:MotA/TolQ/ExbB proton channel family protein n=1 Tax=Sulfuricurvum sp. TaxID=2025608 RepID=UPI00260785B1|nr:MotA/TolQ/ExbB proton channel family protein [Sulfuricurvum sp.]MDD2829301.1 MotA/TolQ/ExbB proton channel family protein [Sulfuricurvum sp.]MDD4948618.1 MotA/TolQ/ExbB proton channel family protein [Sulfuricurvum sp.]